MLQQQTNEVLASALRYAEMGLFVLPVKPGTKEPDTPHGVHDASCDPVQIHRWLDDRPDRNIGIALKPSGLLCVDIDMHRKKDGTIVNGFATLEQVEAKFGKVDAGWIQCTPSGGEHRLFRNPGSTDFKGKFFGGEDDGIDIKSDGYIVAYPSWRQDCSGKQYEWSSDCDPMDGAELSSVPGWLIQGFSKPKAAQIQRVEGDFAGAVLDWQWAEIKSAIKSIPAITRETWLHVGFALHSTGRPDARAVWDEWSKSCPEKYDDEGQEHAWRSFKQRGWDGIGYRSIFKKAQESGWQGISAAEAEAFKGAPSSSGAPTQVREGKQTKFKTFDELLTDAKNLRWVIKHYLPADTIGVLYGASGSGKSWIAIDMAMHVATGIPWYGNKVRQGKVLYIAAEGAAAMAYRIRGWLQGHPNVRNAEQLVRQNVRFFTGVANLSETNPVKTAAVTAEEIKNRLTEENHQPDLVIVDTLSQTMTGDENAASDVAAFMNNIAMHLREPFKACVVVVHHAGKSNSTTPRGSSAIQANTSFLFSVSREGKDMSCQLSCVHMKDSMPAADISFGWKKEVVGSDEDGEDITSVYLVQSGGIDSKGSMSAQAVPWSPEAKFAAAVSRLCDKSGGSAVASEVYQDFAQEIKAAVPNDRRVYRARDAAVRAGLVLYDSKSRLFSMPEPEEIEPPF